MTSRTIEFDNLTINIGTRIAPCDIGSFAGTFDVEDGLIDAICLESDVRGQTGATILPAHALYGLLAIALHCRFYDEIAETVPPMRSDRAEHGTYWGKP